MVPVNEAPVKFWSSPASSPLQTYPVEVISEADSIPSLSVSKPLSINNPPFGQVEFPRFKVVC